MMTAHLLEGAMLVCFGLAWPVANLQMLKSRRPQGKGLPFTFIVLAGYLSGAAAKVVLGLQEGPLPILFWLYALNGASVALNLGLQWHYGPAGRAVRCSEARS